GLTKARQAQVEVDSHGWIGVRAAGIVDAEWWVRLGRTAIVTVRGGELDLPHGHTQFRMERTREIDLGRSRKAVVAAPSPGIDDEWSGIAIAAPAIASGAARSNCHRTPPVHSEAAALELLRRDPAE